MPSAPYTSPDPALAPGTRHAGFTVTQVLPLPELSGTAYVMTHDASGARLMWLAVDDNNKSFAIAFKTPPADSTGVFHILEHSVLCGSDRFPVKEPFVNLLKSSMQTFLNALTFSDKTMYPVASTNEADLENLMDVYLDAVLHPAIYHRPRIFEQEGWHLELVDEKGEATTPDNPDARLAYNGVVFNEMKGALSDPDEILVEALNEDLFPDTPYRFESGGDPRKIPTLTYERFLDTHARHYNLANSYTILYGNLDIERELAFIATRFEGACLREAAEPNPLPVQAPVVARPRQVTMATAPENASVGLSYVVGGALERERMLATEVLVDTLAGSNEAPLKRIILDSGLGDDFTAQLIDSQLQPQLFFQLKGARPNVAEKFRTLVEESCATLVSQGIDHEKIEASLAQAEFNLREGDWGSFGDGVALSVQAMASWLYDDAHPVDYLHFEDAITHMREGLDKGYFESLLDSLVCQSTHNARVELVPAAEGSAAEEQDELARLKDSMSPEQLASVAAEVEALREEQEAPDSPEALATLPHLGVDDIGPAPVDTPMEQVAAPLPCLYHDLPTHRIAYVYHYFDLAPLSFEDLPYVGILSDLLGKLDTATHTASQLDTLVEANLGNLSFFCETYGRDTDLSYARPLFCVGASALSEKIDALATIPAEVWGTTRFDDTEKIRAILTQRRIRLAQGFASSGHSAAISQLESLFSKVSIAANQMGGVQYYLFLRDLLSSWDEQKDALSERLSSLARRIFCARNVQVSFTGTREDLDTFWQAAGTLGLEAGPAEPGGGLKIPNPRPRNLYFTIPANVCFVAEGMAPSRLDTADIGTWQVASRILSFDYLWNEVRVKGGAYGVGFRHKNSGVQEYWSFRDPGITATLERYKGAAPWLAGWSGSTDELEGYIVSVVATLDAPAKARAIARRQDGEYFLDRPADWREQIRRQQLGVTADKIRALAPSMAELADRSYVVVFGPAEAREDAGPGFEVTELSDTQEGRAGQPGEKTAPAPQSTDLLA